MTEPFQTVFCTSPSQSVGEDKCSVISEAELRCLKEVHNEKARYFYQLLWGSFAEAQLLNLLGLDKNQKELFSTLHFSNEEGDRSVYSRLRWHLWFDPQLSKSPFSCIENKTTLTLIFNGTTIFIYMWCWCNSKKSWISHAHSPEKLSTHLKIILRKNHKRDYRRPLIRLQQSKNKFLSWCCFFMY